MLFFFQSLVKRHNRSNLVRKYIIPLLLALFTIWLITAVFGKLIIAILFGVSVFLFYRKEIFYGAALLSLPIGFLTHLWIGGVVLAVVALLRKQIDSLEKDLSQG